MKLFLDTANLADIENALQKGFITGITTNPSLMAKEPKGNYIDHMKKINLEFGRSMYVAIVCLFVCKMLRRTL